MPLYKEIKEDSIRIIVWKIEEDLAFFEKNTSLKDSEKAEFATFKNLRRKKEWLATRFILKHLTKNKAYTKDENGKPILIDESGYISIAHCINFAAVAFSSKVPIGIDIEPIHEKVARVARKFLSEKELAFIEKDHQYLENLTLAWTCKESIYKKYKVPGISFAENIHVDFPTFKNAATTNVSLKKDDKLYVTKVRLLNIENCILAYTI